MSNLVLGHLDFIAHRADKDPKTLEKARGYFRNSIKALYDLPGTDAVRFYLGQAEALWAKHELAAHAGDDGRKDFYEHYGLAKQRWEGLPKGNTFIAQLRAEIALGQPDHIPNIACMFSLASPKSPCDGRRGGCAPCAPLQLVTLRLFNAAIAQGVTEDKIVQMAREKEIATSEKEGLTLYHLYFDSATAPTFAPVPVASVPKPQPAVPSFRTPPSTFKSSTLAPVPQQPHRASRPHA
jgi:hypothetical protein